MSHTGSAARLIVHHATHCVELVKFHSPSSQGDNRHAPANTPGIRHIAFAVAREGLADGVPASSVDGPAVLERPVSAGTRHRYSSSIT